VCGIVGFVGDNSAAGTAFEALKRLEYRGYDSAGMAVVHDSMLWVKKDVGKLAEVEKSQGLAGLPGNTAIAHTRWATHGQVTPYNAHPHVDCTGDIAVVHNGVIENYQQLRRYLEGVGHVFTSDTDSEVIPHLIEESRNGQGNGDRTPLEDAVHYAIRSLRGSFAFLAVASDEPGKIVGVAKDSPLVLGVANDGCFAASDPICFLDQTNQVIPLEDGEVSVMTRDGVVFLDGSGTRVRKKATSVNWKWEDADKGNHAHYMLKEILEQPQAVKNAIRQDKEFFTDVAMDILRANQVIITACGSSRFAALVGRYLFSKVAGKFCGVVMAPEFHYFAESLNNNTVVIAVSQSGETADVIEGVKRAREHGARIISIVNREGTILSRLSDKIISLNAGPEIGVAATKSFSNQLVIFYLLAFAMINQFDNGVRKIEELSLVIEKAIDYDNRNLGKLVRRLDGREDFYYIARGINFAIASEGALKLKEISYIHAEGLPAGELKHGTLALIEEGTPAVVICPKDYTFYETLTNAMEAKSRGAFIIGVSDEPNDIYDYWIQIPKVEELFYPLVTVGPLQLLAYHSAIGRGKDPDRPRNLAKSVTVK
jgi:glucosamine--fructose-6-phosphate aminotransferase (isomerizing)